MKNNRGLLRYIIATGSLTLATLNCFFLLNYGARSYSDHHDYRKKVDAETITLLRTEKERLETLPPLVDPVLTESPPSFTPGAGAGIAVEVAKEQHTDKTTL